MINREQRRCRRCKTAPALWRSVYCRACANELLINALDPRIGRKALPGARAQRGGR